MIHSFLLIGQSNMAGRGFLDEAVGVDTSLIKILRNGRWQPLYRPVTPDRITSGVCLAESFAEAYAKKYGVEVGLIPCADGGTQISQWLPGSLLYDHAVFQAKLAQRTSTIAGVLWHQGESLIFANPLLSRCPHEKGLTPFGLFFPPENVLEAELLLSDAFLS